MALVVTTLGDIDERDLRISLIEQPEAEFVWVVAREGVYIGNAPEHQHALNTIVRRDVWVTFKRGQAAEAVSDSTGVEHG